MDIVTALWGLITPFLNFALHYKIATIGGKDVYLWYLGIVFIIAEVVVDLTLVRPKLEDN